MISNEFVDTGENVHTYQQAKLAKKNDRDIWALFDDKLFVKNQPKKLSNFLIQRHLFEGFFTMKSFPFSLLSPTLWNQSYLDENVDSVDKSSAILWLKHPSKGFVKTQT